MIHANTLVEYEVLGKKAKSLKELRDHIKSTLLEQLDTIYPELYMPVKEKIVDGMIKNYELIGTLLLCTYDNEDGSCEYLFKKATQE
jgi:hypothetical protein